MGALSFVLVSALFAWLLTSPTRRPLATPPEKFLSNYENVSFPARDGVLLKGWFVPAEGSNKAVILLHGYGSTRTQMLARAKFFHDQGYAALLYDARGHGESGASLVSFGHLETRDLQGALDWLRARGFKDFGCLGASQGGATIALAAGELTDVRWAVIESVYPTLTNAIDQRFRRTLLLPGWFAGSLLVPMAEWRLGFKASIISPRDTIGRLSCPLLVMSGERDTHTRPSGALDVFDRAHEPKSWWLVPGAAHVDLYGFAKKDYEQHLLAFISKANETANPPSGKTATASIKR